VEKRGIVILASVELIQVVLQDVQKAKETQMREEQVAAKSRNFSSGQFYSSSEVQRRHFCGTCSEDRKSKNML